MSSPSLEVASLLLSATKILFADGRGHSMGATTSPSSPPPPCDREVTPVLPVFSRQMNDAVSSSLAPSQGLCTIDSESVNDEGMMPA